MEAGLRTPSSPLASTVLCRRSPGGIFLPLSHSHLQKKAKILVSNPSTAYYICAMLCHSASFAL